MKAPMPEPDQYRLDVAHYSIADTLIVLLWPGAEGCYKVATSTEKYSLHIWKNVISIYPPVLKNSTLNG